MIRMGSFPWLRPRGENSIVRWAAEHFKLVPEEHAPAVSAVYLAEECLHMAKLPEYEAELREAFHCGTDGWPD